MTTPRLRMTAVQKRFGATKALKNVSFTVAPGEVHALIGENGAGKSTLMKILSGAHRPDAGTVELDGQPFVSDNPLHARRSGIAMIYQELTLAPHLSVEENILLGEEPARFGWLNRTRRGELARAALAELRHENIPLNAPVHSRTIAEQQIVEIARALVGQPKLLIMDEPTSSLTKVDTENLFAVIARLRQRGVSVIYISHFLEECQRIADRYTVLRDGESVATDAMPGADLNHIIRLMVGREITDIYPRSPHRLGETVFELKDFAGAEKPHCVNLKLRRGEILGIAGLIGAGRTETLRACFGLDRVKSGAVVLESNAKASCTPAGRLASGVGLLSENRKEEGLMLNRSLADNLTLTRFGPVSHCGFVQRSKQWQAAQHWMSRLEVRAQHPGQAIAELSGGNQQKIAIGRLLHHEATVLLLDEPTRGIDVGSKAQIYRLMGELAAQGKAVIFVSSYLPELLGVCDTIGVMCRGVLSEVRPVTEWTEHGIIAAAIGQTAPPNRNTLMTHSPTSRNSKLLNALNIFGPFFGLLLVLGLFSLSAEVRPYLFTGANFKIILIQTVIVAIGALGMTMIIVSGGIDLSVGSVVALTSVLGAILLVKGYSTVATVVITVLAGGFIGLINGSVIAGFRMMPFIVTLGMMGIVRGLAKWLAGNQTVNNPPNAPLNDLMARVSPTTLFPLPPGVWIAIALAIIVSIIMRQTVFGRYIFAIGSNEATARLCGIRVRLQKVFIYSLAGLFFGLAGVMQVSRLTQGDPTVAIGLELDIIAAVVIGGASLSGGTGSILGSMIGALIMAVLRNGSNQMGWQNFTQEIIIGIVIIIAVGLDQLRQRRTKS